MNIRILAVVGAMFLALGSCGVCQSHDRSSLCELQTNAKEGEKQEVRVEGVLLAGLEGEYLVVAHCSGRATVLDFGEVRDHRKLDSMWRMVDKPNAVRGVHGDGAPILVVFEGDFYGPPIWDPKLPEPIRRLASPGWDSNARTKLVVHTVRSFKALPVDDPCKPPKPSPTEWPCFQKD